MLYVYALVERAPQPLGKGLTGERLSVVAGNGVKVIAARQENELSESRITIRQIDAVVVVPKGVPDHGIYCTPTLRDRRGEPTA